MKAFAAALSLLVASVAAVNEHTVSILNNHADTDMIEKVVPEQASSLRHGRRLPIGDNSTNTNSPERMAAYKKAHNDMRRKYHPKFGGEFVPLNWNMELKSEAEAFAKKLAKDCVNRVPQAGENPNNYGVNSILNSGSDFPDPVSVMGLWENKLPKGYPANGVFTQVLWSKTLYVGCADASSPSKSKEICTASVCFYAKAGNCAFGRFDGNVTQAVINGPACSTECPSNLKDGC